MFAPKPMATGRFSRAYIIKGTRKKKHTHTYLRKTKTIVIPLLSHLMACTILILKSVVICRSLVEIVLVKY
mgnify:CR=1 FL=1